MGENNMDDQKEELIALESILCSDSEDRAGPGSEPEFYFEQISEESQTLNQCSSGSDLGTFFHRGQVRIAVSLCKPVKLLSAVGGIPKEAELQYVPPLYVNFLLSSDYPSLSPPLCHLAAVWLDSRICSEIHDEIDRICKENDEMPVLFAIIQGIQDFLPTVFPQELNLLHFRPFRDISLCSNARKPLPNSSNKPEACGILSIKQRRRSTSGQMPGKSVPLTSDQLFALLLDYDQLGGKLEFESQWFSCDVCLEERKGDKCLRFSPCRHVFCKECVGSYFAVQIKEGACDSHATPQQVREAVQDDVLYERYDSLLLSQTLDLMSDVTICPRPSCQQPVLLEQNSAGEALSIASCAVCALTFCTYCRKVYHGVSECAFTARDQDRLLKEYESGDAAKKRRMEQRYGRHTLRTIQDSRLAQIWISENSKPCPHCTTPIEKKDGCNKMWCRKCGNNFCWLCGEKLHKMDPYNHFNNPKARCYNRLFYGVEQHMEEDEFSDEEDEDEFQFAVQMGLIR